MASVRERLQAILKWSVCQAQATDGEDEEREDIINNETAQERREWLNEVLETLSRQPDETQLLKAALSVLDIHSEKEILNSEELSVVVQAFEHVQYFVEDLDHASDLIPLKGVDTINKYLTHTNSELVDGACSIITNASQNHEKCQQVFAQSSLSQLMSILKREGEPLLQKKAVSAISSIVRGYEPALNIFLQQDGVSSLVSCLNDSSKGGSQQVVIKVYFFLQHLYCQQHVTLEAAVSDVLSTISITLSNTTNHSNIDLLEQALLTLYQVMQVYHSIATPIWRKVGLSLPEPVLRELGESVCEETKDKLSEMVTAGIIAN